MAQPLTALRDLFRTARQVRGILRQDQTPGLSRHALARAYGKIALKTSQARHFGRRFASPESVLGLTFHFIGYTTFRYLFKEVFVHQDYFFRTDNAAPLILDGGSNIGVSVLYFKTLYPAARIVAFEPGHEACALLRKNVEANALEDVQVVEAALSDQAGEATFYVDPAHAASMKMSLRAERMPGDTATVQTVRLSDYIEEPVDFLKLDVEGAEHAVLHELAQSGTLRQIAQMVIEYHHHIEAGEDRLGELLGVLEQNGFGYQLRCPAPPPFRRAAFQDMLIYAYRKGGA